MHGKNQPPSSIFQSIILIIAGFSLVAFLLKIFPLYFTEIVITLFILAIVWSIACYTWWIFEWLHYRNLAKNRGAILLVRDSNKNDIWVFHDRIESKNNVFPLKDIGKIEVWHKHTVHLFEINKYRVTSFDFFKKPYSKDRLIGAICKIAQLKRRSSFWYDR